LRLPGERHFMPDAIVNGIAERQARLRDDACHKHPTPGELGLLEHPPASRRPLHDHHDARYARLAPGGGREYPAAFDPATAT